MSKGHALRTPAFSLLAILLAGGAWFGIGSMNSAHAQTAATGPQFILTWQALNSEVPSSYIGKALPSYGSKITADVSILENGKLENLSGQTIYWYLNDTLIGGGAGVTGITFTPFGTPPSSLTLKVELPSDPEGYLVHSIQIPLVPPQAVILAPYPGGDFSSNPVEVTAIPYFFNASSSGLTYAWAVNGQTGGSAENPESAAVTLPGNTPSGTGITVALAITNPANHVSANAQSTLTYESQL
jgi:hypothetical protein